MCVTIGSVNAGVFGQGIVPAGPPLMIPGSEAYYWSAKWQAEERESLEALDSGERVVFDSDDPADLARWLLSDDA